MPGLAVDSWIFRTVAIVELLRLTLGPDMFVGGKKYRVRQALEYVRLVAATEKLTRVSDTEAAVDTVLEQKRNRLIISFL